jgi:SM-20-related protein
MKFTVQPPGATQIKVTLLLSGGQSAALAVPPDHPLLAQLLAAVAGADEMPNGAPAVFQIPMEGGRASLIFPAHQLVGMITDPAVVVQKEEPTATEAAGAAPSGAVAAAAAASAARGYADRVRHPIVQIDGFLTEAEVAWLMQLTFAAEGRFVRSRVSDAREDYRHSLMLAAPHEVWQLMIRKIKAAMPEVMPQLHLGNFPIGNIDCQITASIDGSYFKAHTDAGSNETYKRQFTYVYYFNREPKGFTGGELRVYDDAVRNGKLAATDSFQVIEPRHNSIAFFQAAVMHEVMPVSVPSKQFRDARFTVNGWIERQ